MLNNLPDPHSNLQASVIVPAKNEEVSIELVLEALCHQYNEEGKALDYSIYEVILFVNNCTDRTAEVAQRFAGRNPKLALYIYEAHVPPHQANIGFIRRTLMDKAYNRLMSIGRYRGVIISTDGDTIVSSTWLHHTLQAVRMGADAVGGRILTQAQEGCDYRLFYLQDVCYRFLQAELESTIDPNTDDSWPRHFQNFGPSLAVTAEMYDRAGRLPIVPCLEDVYFYEALQRCDARIRHCPKVQVTTSTRLEGRVDFGFSKQLQTWEEMHQKQIPLEVRSAEEWQCRFQLQKALRLAWRTKSSHLLESIGKQYNLPLGQFYYAMLLSQFFGEFWYAVIRSSMVESYLQQMYPEVPIAEAINQLRLLIRNNQNTAPTLEQPPIGRVGIFQPDDDTNALVV
ncbi:MAG: glycosyltransferase [Tunicatimonas sp.]|uniref:glycosyltransferase n=1 Tax=Tunicatimonas sp. TaxID=1940096 RepID=UPI003C793855